MKLYVWTGVLHEYTAGMAVAIAPDKGTALELAAAAGVYEHGLGDLATTEPEVIDLGRRKLDPKFWHVYGGG